MKNNYLFYLAIAIITTISFLLMWSFEMELKEVRSERYEDIELICCGTTDQKCSCVEVWIDGEFIFSEEVDTILADTKRWIK